MIDHTKLNVEIEGLVEEVQQLRKQVNDHSQNPRHFVQFVDVDATVDQEFIGKLKQECIRRHQINDLAVQGSQIKITGFNSDVARKFVKKALALRAK